MQRCSSCGEAAAFQAVRCPGCDAPLLYGLIASPVRDTATQERAAALIAAVPGGPSPAEARRRVREGLPLIVGLSRHATEQLQGRLVDLGLLPRLGPAPRGTSPLEPEGASGGARRWVAAALAVPIVALALYGWWEPAAPAPAEATDAPASVAATSAPSAEARRVELNATIQRARFGLVLVCQARVRGTGPLPGGDLTLRLRDPSGTVVWTHEASGRRARRMETTVGGEPGAQKVLDVRTDLRELFLRGGERLTLEADWQGWRGGPMTVDAPAPPPPR